MFIMQSKEREKGKSHVEQAEIDHTRTHTTLETFFSFSFLFIKGITYSRHYVHRALFYFGYSVY